MLTKINMEFVLVVIIVIVAAAGILLGWRSSRSEADSFHIVEDQED